MHTTMKLDNVTLESKLNKIAIMDELESEVDKIQNGTFFESKNKKMHSNKNSLGDSIKEQHKAFRGQAAANRLAREYLEKRNLRRKQEFQMKKMAEQGL